MFRKHTLAFVAFTAFSLPAISAQPLKPGNFVCEDKYYNDVTLPVRAHPDKPGKIILRYGGRDRILHNVPTKSGALRYEGAVSKLVYIQTPSHSVLLDDHNMRPLLTDCKLMKDKL